jgi:hypothetical protein
VRELARRRETSVSKLIVSGLQAELLADEIGNGASNGRPVIGSGWSRTIVPRPTRGPTDSPLPEYERYERVAECRRGLAGFHTVVDGTWLAGVPIECVEQAQRAFDAQLGRSLAERAAPIAERQKEDENAAVGNR